MTDVSALLTSKIIGHPFYYYPEVTSTNDVAQQFGNKGAPEGLVVFADSQTQGRGRLGRQWNSHPGQSLTFSILLRPDWSNVSRISLVAAVAMARVLERLTTHSVGIKWPNDIQIDGKKVAGILCEAGKKFIVIGIGLNVSQTTLDFPEELRDRAGFIGMFATNAVNRIELAAALLNELDAIYLTLPAELDSIIAECGSRSVLLEKPITAKLGDHSVTGIVTGLDVGGGLRVRQKSGAETVISSGEVTLLKTSLA
ncbi:MAG: biotin--[acetyl-CoA-carboxylase] ligase [Chthoniobacterales bacterium]